MVTTILILEDDKELQKYLRNLLTQENYSVRLMGDGINALEEVEKINPDLILLDLMLPSINGTSVCREIKADYPDLPIIVLTGKTGLNDKINAFELGADDYVTKPFAPEELLLRIKARLKDRSIGVTQSISVGDLKIDTTTMQVTRGSKEITLTPQEYKLLEYMIANTGKVLTRDSLLNKIWPNSFDIETRVIDVYISYLRKKIDKGFKHKLIHCIRGFGYTVKV